MPLRKKTEGKKAFGKKEIFAYIAFFAAAVLLVAADLMNKLPDAIALKLVGGVLVVESIGKFFLRPYGKEEKLAQIGRVLRIAVGIYLLFR